MLDKTYSVYILSSKRKVLYIGVTSNLPQRIYQHKHKLVKCFTKRYNVDRLVYFTETNDVMEAICFEKKVKGWTRAKKIALVESMNPDWDDLAASWEFIPE